MGWVVQMCWLIHGRVSMCIYRGVNPLLQSSPRVFHLVGWLAMASNPHAAMTPSLPFSRFGLSLTCHQPLLLVLLIAGVHPAQSATPRVPDGKRIYQKQCAS